MGETKFYADFPAARMDAVRAGLLLYDLMHSTVINSIRTDKRTVSGLYGARERDYFQTNGVIAQCFNPGISMSGNSTISAEILSGVSGQTWFLNMSFITFVDQLP
jgi:hypothetical protein